MYNFEVKVIYLNVGGIMQRYIGTVVRGIRTPIVKSGDNLVDIVVDS